MCVDIAGGFHGSSLCHESKKINVVFETLFACGDCVHKKKKAASR